MAKRIHLSAPLLGPGDQEAVAEALASGWIAPFGPALAAFEDGFTAFVEGRPCVAVSSGTAAIHLGLRLLGVGPGDDVLVPSLTFVASAAPVVYLGARPVFVDSERATWGIDPELVLVELLRRRREGEMMPAAVIAVHLYGQAAEMEILGEICGAYGVPILEDCAEALGASAGGKPVGTFGSVAAFSFNGNKMLTCGGGGMLVTATKEMAERALGWATQAKLPCLEYAHRELGYNYRLSNVLAALGASQLRWLGERVARKRALFASYVENLAGIGGLWSPMPGGEGHCRWLSVFLQKDVGSTTRDRTLERLADANIEARPVWKPMHMQALFAGERLVGSGEVAEDLYRRGICLPSGCGMSDGELEEVVRRCV